MSKLGSRLIAQRYARAFLGSTQNHDLIIGDIETFKEFFEAKEVSDFINSKIVSTQNKLHVLCDITNKTSDPKLWENTFSLILKKGRGDLVIVILDEIYQMILTEQNKERVKINFAREVSESTVNLIKAQIESKIGKEVILDIEIDPTVIGGFFAESHTLSIDGSISRSLQKFAESFKH